jgi:hypothetical protein
MFCAALVLFSGCGLFSPRDVEQPLASERHDPMSFADILKNSNTRIRFSRLDFEDLFNAAFEYIHAEDNESFTKNDMLARLNTVKRLYPEIIVDWSLADSQENLDHETYYDYEIPELQNRAYTISAEKITVMMDSVSGENDTLHEEIEYSGQAAFKLKYDPNLTAWTILQWNDYPLDGTERSFFHPLF